MAKLKHLLSLLLVLTQCCAFAQSYRVTYIGVDVDSSVLLQKASLQTAFPTKAEAALYAVKLPSI